MAENVITDFLGNIVSIAKEAGTAYNEYKNYPYQVADQYGVLTTPTYSNGIMADHQWRQIDQQTVEAESLIPGVGNQALFLGCIAIVGVLVLKK